ncbi:metallopeptidase [Sporosarcina sp. NCCP-2716]|uniref:M1 family metallopeptidase n=1 Tax=Sporosarcina sp. NCCP-2716 TaxID=2943679 RepID=UPI00203D75FD|nr:M1 family metallopeptidase [Sporosarcina sp. NCCP-2716]GKV69940.1 metallopeptidase [Sporosarcina sp. NCCP-2716]
MLKRLVPLLLIITLAGCTDKSEPATPPTADSYTADELGTSTIVYGPAAPYYTIEANYDETTHTVTGRMTVTFVNNLGEPLDEVLFNVWPNADEFGGAGADVRDVRVDGQPAEASLEGTVLTVSGVSIAEGATAEAELEFTVKVPEQHDRFGWSYRQTSLGSWFPTLAVHDNHGWNTPPYFPYGESFYSVTGTFDVTFSAPADLEILATGGEQSRTEDGSTQTVHFTADDVRDFFILLNTPYHTIQEQIGGIEVTVAYRDGEDAAAQTMMETARDVIPRYESWFGHYPWETLTIASADYSSDFDGGMEYPRLVTVNTPHIEDDEELGVTAAHEIAHQWFYSLVGSNPYREPWLDESLTTFASYAAYYDTTDFDWIETVADDYSLTSSVDDFEEDDYDRYGDIMYDGGAKMLSYLHGELGDHAFWNALRAYAVDRKYKIATTADFLRVMQEATDENLKPFFEGHQLFIDETLY